MKERKDLKRMSAAMMKVKSPLKNGDGGKATYSYRKDNQHGIGAGAQKTTVKDMDDPTWEDADIEKGKTKATYTHKPGGGEIQHALYIKKGEFGQPKEKPISKKRYDRITKRWTKKAIAQNKN